MIENKFHKSIVHPLNLGDEAKPAKTAKRISRKVKVYAGLVIIAVVAFGTFKTFQAISGFFDSHTFVFRPVFEFKFNQPVKLEKRTVSITQIVNVMEAIPEPQNLTNDLDKYIYKVFGVENYKMAIAVSKCEGYSHPADGFNVNSNGSIDVGKMRINSSNFKIPGCSLLEVATDKGNIDCGYIMWDRADGIVGNNQGNFSPWVGFTNGCAATKYN